MTDPVHGNHLDLPSPPRRVVSFVSSATETLFALGCGESLIGATPYCGRYVEGLSVPIAGDYLKADIASLRPEVILLFQEPEHPVDGPALLAERGWTWGPRLVGSDITKGRNIIHDGPSYLPTARWPEQARTTPEIPCARKAPRSRASTRGWR